MTVRQRILVRNVSASVNAITKSNLNRSMPSCDPSGKYEAYLSYPQDCMDLSGDKSRLDFFMRKRQKTVDSVRDDSVKLETEDIKVKPEIEAGPVTGAVGLVMEKKEPDEQQFWRFSPLVTTEETVKSEHAREYEREALFTPSRSDNCPDRLVHAKRHDNFSSNP